MALPLYERFVSGKRGFSRPASFSVCDAVHDSLDETCNLGVDTTLVPVADLFQAQPKFRFRLQGVAALQVLKCLRTLEPRLNHSPTLTPGVLWSWDAKERLTVLFNFFNFLFALLF